MKKVLAIVLAAVMLIGLCACAAAGVAVKNTEWKLTALETGGLKVDEEFLEGLGASGSIVFDNKQAVVSVNGETETVDYSVDENTVTMVGVTGETRVATIEGNTMVISMGDDGVMTFTKVE